MCGKLEYPVISLERLFIYPEDGWYRTKSAEEKRLLESFYKNKSKFITSTTEPRELLKGKYFRIGNIAQVIDVIQGPGEYTLWNIRTENLFQIGEVCQCSDDSKLSIAQGNIIACEEFDDAHKKAKIIEDIKSIGGDGLLEKHGATIESNLFLHRAMIVINILLEDRNEKLNALFLTSSSNKEKIEFIRIAILTVKAERKYNLAKSYLQFRLYEKASEELRDFLSEGTSYEVPIKNCLIESEYHLGNYRYVIELFESRKKELSDYPFALLYTGKSYYRLNDPINAHQFFRDYHNELPRINESIYDFETKEYELTDLTKLLLEMQEQGISIFAGLEYIIPVITGARAVAQADYSEFLIEAEPYKIDDDHLNYIAKYLWVTHQIKLKELFTYAGTGENYRLIPRLFVYKEAKYTSLIEEFRSMYYNLLESGNSEKAVAFLIEGEGKILGYPKCCIDKVLEYEEKKKTSEIRKRLSEELVYEREVHLHEYPHTFFTNGFYPCSVNCSAAKKVGMRESEILSQKLNEDAFNDVSYLVVPNLEHIEEWDNQDAYGEREEVIECVSAMKDIDFWNQEKVKREMFKKLRES